MTWKGSIEPLHRLYGSLPYLLPMSAAAIYGAALFKHFPLLAYPFLPFFWLYQNVLMFPILPQIGLMGEFVILIGLYALVIRDHRIDRFIRFNTMQALLLEIVLFLLQIIFRIVAQGLQNLPSTLFASEIIMNTIFFGMTAACIYAVVENVRGCYSAIPGISEAALMQCDS